jgi:hypothetical protein
MRLAGAPRGQGAGDGARSAYTANAEPVAIAAIAVARAVARSTLSGWGDVHRPGPIVTAAWAVA